MMDPKQLEKVMLLVKQYTAWARKWERWHAMADNGIWVYLINHDENFGEETYWTRFHRLQNYANAKMVECLRQQKIIGDKIAVACQEGV